MRKVAVAVRGVTNWDGERLRVIRTARRISRRRIARQIGVAIGTVAAWEQGRNAPTVRHLRAVAEVLDVPIAHLAPLPPIPTVRALRERAGLSQQEFADEIGISTGTLAANEHGDSWPSGAARWCEVLDVDEATLRAAWEYARANPD